MRTARRWIIFVLTSLATFALGVSIAPLNEPHSHRRAQVSVTVSSQQSHWPVLLSFLDRDLSKLDRQSEAALRHAIDTVTGGMDPDLSPSLKPRVFQLVSTSTGENRFMLVEICNLVFTPGSSHLRLMLFDLEGRLLYSKTSDFHKELFVKFYVRKSTDVGGDVLVAETISLPGSHKTHYFYELVGNEIHHSIKLDAKGRR